MASKGGVLLLALTHVDFQCLVRMLPNHLIGDITVLRCFMVAKHVPCPSVVRAQRLLSHKHLRAQRVRRPRTRWVLPVSGERQSALLASRCEPEMMGAGHHRSHPDQSRSGQLAPAILGKLIIP
jgi:hypothetical protein